MAEATVTVTTPGPAGAADPTARPIEVPRAAIVATSTPPFRISPRRNAGDRWLKMLVYGPYGVGKSTLAGSSVDVTGMRDVLMVDAESGDLVLQDNPRIVAADEIEHVRVSNF